MNFNTWDEMWKQLCVLYTGPSNYNTGLIQGIKPPTVGAHALQGPWGEGGEIMLVNL